MDYQLVTTEKKIEGLTNRLGQLESQHYTNEIYILEATALGDIESLRKFQNEQKGLEVSITAITQELEKLNNLPITVDSNDEQ